MRINAHNPALMNIETGAAGVVAAFPDAVIMFSSFAYLS
jgi:hypothetical protein